MLFIALALYGLNVTTIYTSKLITVFTQPAYEDQIDTILEIIESGLPIGGREDYHDWFDNEDPGDELFYRLYNSSKDFWPTVANLKAIRNGQRVVLLSRLYVLSTSINEVFPLPRNVFSNPVEMITERGFPLLKRVSRLIMYMIDGGIMAKLYKDFMFNATVLEHIRNRNNISETKQIVLTLMHMEGAFTVLLLGLTLSALALITELLTNWYTNKKLSHKYWKMLRYRMRRKAKAKKRVLMARGEASKQNR